MERERERERGISAPSCVTFSQTQLLVIQLSNKHLLPLFLFRRQSASARHGEQKSGRRRRQQAGWRAREIGSEREISSCSNGDVMRGLQLL